MQATPKAYPALVFWLQRFGLFALLLPSFYQISHITFFTC
jgi:hypothetical protein